MRTTTTTLRILVILATLALHTQVTFATTGIQQEEEHRLSLAERHVESKERVGRSFRMGRMLKRGGRRSNNTFSKRRKHDEEDSDDEDEDEEDQYDEYSEDDYEDERDSPKARQFLTSDDLDDNNPSYTIEDPDDGDNDPDDQVVAGPGGAVQVKPARISTSVSADDATSVVSNAKASLARATATDSLTTSSATSSASRRITVTSSSSASTTSSTSSSTPSPTTTSQTSTTSSPSTSTSAPIVTSTVTTDEDSSTSSASPTATSAVDDAADDSDDDASTSAPITSVWSAFNSSSKWFPVAIIVTILVGIAALVITVALLQCIARSPRFSKKQKDRPLLIPSDSSWGGSDTSRRSSLLSNEKRNSIASLPASRVASTIGAHRNRDTYTKFPARPAGPGHRSSSTASLVKEDFLPHSYDPEPESLAHLGSVYPALEKRAQSPAYNSSSPAMMGPSRRSTPAPVLFPYPETVPTLQRMEPAAYPYNSPNHAFGSNPYKTPIPSRLPSLPHIPRMQESSLSRFPTILTPGRSSSPAIIAHDEGPNSRVRHSYSVTSSTARYSQYGPRPGRSEQQSVARASLNEQMLQQQMARKQYDEAPRLPVGVMERRRWERCVT